MADELTDDLLSLKPFLEAHHHGTEEIDRAVQEITRLRSLVERVEVALERRSVPTMDPVWTGGFNSALDMVRTALENSKPAPDSTR